MKHHSRRRDTCSRTQQRRRGPRWMSLDSSHSIARIHAGTWHARSPRLKISPPASHSGGEADVPHRPSSRWRSQLSRSYKNQRNRKQPTTETTIQILEVQQQNPPFRRVLVRPPFPKSSRYIINYFGHPRLDPESWFGPESVRFLSPKSDFGRKDHTESGRTQLSRLSLG